MDDARAPKRIQRRRTKGWTKPEGAVYVGRGSKWGNPIVVGTSVKSGAGSTCIRTKAEAARYYRLAFSNREALIGQNGIHWSKGECWTPPTTDMIRAELAGKTLMCWCAEDQPCHADALLEIANRPA